VTRRDVRENLLPADALVIAHPDVGPEVAVARALMNDPPLVLADEPTGNLDMETSDQVMELLLRRNSESSTAFLIVTHDPDLARRCERVIELVDGAVVRDGPPVRPNI
jgi:lipoprotein-releasing system ATP-binding protein